MPDLALGNLQVLMGSKTQPSYQEVDSTSFLI